MNLLYKFIALTLLFITITVYANELETRKIIKSRVQHLFMTENFKELDAIADKYKNKKERTGSGVWKLTGFYYGFNHIAASNIKDEKYWEDLNKKADKWLKESPTSSTANIAKGIILKGYAWKFRGESWAKDVPVEAWKPFRENLKVAEEFMIKTKSISSKDPHWYEVLVSIKKGLNEDSDKFKSFVKEGLDRYPYYYQLYFAALDYLAPKWHGNKNEIEKFAKNAVERTKEIEGNGMYARIYWYASQTQYSEKIFSESNVVWAKMKDGIIDVIKKYPDSWNIQNFAFFACLAKDKSTTRMLMEKITSPIIMRAWKKQEYYDYCKVFAYSK